MQKSKDSLKACFENENIGKWLEYCLLLKTHLLIQAKWPKIRNTVTAKIFAKNEIDFVGILNNVKIPNAF